ncbi:MAG: NACHT domain-containing protein [Gammaproteobacteria bacterium]
MPNQKCINDDSKETESGRVEMAIQAQYSQVGRDQLIAGRDIHFTQNNMYPSSAKDPRKKLVKKDKKNQKLLNDFKQSLKQSYRSPEKATILSNLSDGGLPLEDIFTPLSLIVVDSDGEDDNLEEKAEDNEKKSSPHEKSAHTQDENDNDKEALSDKNSVLEKKEELLSKEPTMEEDSTADMDESKTSSLRRIHNTHYEQLRNPNKSVPLSELILLQIPHDSLLDDINEQQAYRQILHGQAGVGKSTLCSFIAWDWASRDEYNSELQLAQKGYGWVFHLSMKNLVQPQYDYIFQYSDEKKRNPLLILASLIFEECLIEGIKNNWHSRREKIEFELAKLFEPRMSQLPNNKVLWVLDGLDDATSHLNQGDIKSDVLSALLLMPYIFITTRPCRIDSFLRRIKIHRYLGTVGFTDKQITVYVNKYFKFIKKKEEAEGCLKQLQTLQDTVWGVAHVPLLLQLLCIQYQNAYQREQSRPWHFDDNLADLYKGFIRHFFERHQSKVVTKIGKASKSKKEKLLLDNKVLSQQIFLKHLAFDGLKEERIILDIKIIERALKHAELKDFSIINQLGFLQLVSDNRTESNIQNTTTETYEFPHLTLQEYYAAWYAVDILNDLNSPPQTQEDIKKVLIKHRYDMAWGWVWQFMFGIISRKTPDVDYKNAEEALWAIVWQLPQDLLGVGHMQLLGRCLEGALGGNTKFLSDERCQQWLDFVIQETKLSDENYIWSNLRTLLQTLPHLRRALTYQLFNSGKQELEKYCENPMTYYMGYDRDNFFFIDDHIEGFFFLSKWESWEKDVFIDSKIDEWFKVLLQKYPQWADNFLMLLEMLGGQAYTPILTNCLFTLLREQPLLEQRIKNIFENYLSAWNTNLISLQESQVFLQEKTDDMDADVRFWAIRLLCACIRDIEHKKFASTVLIERLMSFIPLINDEEKMVHSAAINGLIEFSTTIYANEVIGQLIALWEKSETEVELKKILEPAICAFMPAIILSNKDNVENIEKLLQLLESFLMPCHKKFAIVKEWIANAALRMALKAHGWKLITICLVTKKEIEKPILYYPEEREIANVMDFLLTALSMTEEKKNSRIPIFFTYLDKYYKCENAYALLHLIAAKSTLPYFCETIITIKEYAWQRIEKLIETLSESLKLDQKKEKDDAELSLDKLPLELSIVNCGVIKIKKKKEAKAIISKCLSAALSYNFFQCLTLQYDGDTEFRQSLFDKILESWKTILESDDEYKENELSKLPCKIAMESLDWIALLSRESSFVVKLCEEISQQAKMIYGQEKANSSYNPLAKKKVVTMLEWVLFSIKKVLTEQSLLLSKENQGSIVIALQSFFDVVSFSDGTTLLYHYLLDVLQALPGPLSLGLSLNSLVEPVNKELSLRIKCKAADTANHLLAISDPKKLINKYRNELDSRYQNERLKGWEVLFTAYCVCGNSLLLHELLEAIARYPGSDISSIIRVIDKKSIKVTDESVTEVWENMLNKPLTKIKTKLLFSLLSQIKLKEWSEAAQKRLVNALCLLLPQNGTTYSGPRNNVLFVLASWVSVLPICNLPDGLGEALFAAAIMPNNFFSTENVYSDFLELIEILNQKAIVEQRERWLSIAFHHKKFIYKNILPSKAIAWNMQRRLQRTIDELINGLPLKKVLEIINNIVSEWEREWLSNDKEKPLLVAPEREESVFEDSSEENSDEADWSDNSESINIISDDFSDLEEQESNYMKSAMTCFIRLLKKETLSVVCKSENNELVCTLPIGIMTIDNVAPVLMAEVQEYLTFRYCKKLSVPSLFFPNNVDNKEKIASNCGKRKRAPLANSPPLKRQRTIFLEDSEKNITKTSNSRDRGYCICM